MFGIGLPEMIVIFAVALIVVGPDKLPGLARSLAKGLLEMKKTLNQVKENLTEEGEVLNSVQADLKKTAEELKGKMIDVDPSSWQPDPVDQGIENKKSDIIDVQPIAAPSQDKSLPTAALPSAPHTEGTESTSAEPAAASEQPAGSFLEKQPTPPKDNHA